MLTIISYNQVLFSSHLIFLLFNPYKERCQMSDVFYNVSFYLIFSLAVSKLSAT
jgi:hypothetical protein